MHEQPTMDDRAADLIVRYLDGALTDAEMAQLNEFLTSNDRLRHYLWIACRVACQRHDYGRDAAESLKITKSQQSRPVAAVAPRTAMLAPRWITAAALLLAAAAVAVYLIAANGRPTIDQPPSLPGPVATVIQAEAAVWSSDPLAPGEVVRAGHVVLESGRVEMLMDSGVTATLVGPVDLTLVSKRHVRLSAGLVHADVPPSAIGFSIDGPGFRVVDLGTEFVVDVPADGAGPSRVQVLVGSVELATATQRMVVTAAETGMIDGGVARLEEALPPIVVVEPTPQVRWKQVIDALAADPALVDHSPMNTIGNDAGRFTEDKSFRPDGSIHSVDQTGDPSGSMTLAAWVSIDDLNANVTALLVSERDAPGRLHWQLTREGRMVLGTDRAFVQTAYRSDRTLSGSDMQRWVMLAVATDAAAGRVRFYIDGEPAGDVPMLAGDRFLLADAVIGDSARWPGRRLNGRIDDLIVLGRAMSDLEIANLYAAGCPPQKELKGT